MIFQGHWRPLIEQDLHFADSTARDPASQISQHCTVPWIHEILSVPLRGAIRELGPPAIVVGIMLIESAVHSPAGMSVLI
jgi:hypothetical protein